MALNCIKIGKSGVDNSKIGNEKIVKNVSFVILLMKMSLVLGQDSLDRKTIIIDVGHSGNDSGAIRINGLQEKDVVLKIAREIVLLNKEILDDKFEIYLTRYNDILISLRDRTKLARTLKADLFISLHCNQAINSSAKGTEVFVSNSKGKYSKKSILMGYLINDTMVKELGFKNRGVKSANFQVFRETINHCPGILIEMGFISSSDEADYYFKLPNKRAVALAILLSTNNYFKNKL